MSDATRRDPRLAAVVDTSQGRYPVIVGSGAVADIGRYMHNAGLSGRAFLIADHSMFPVLVRRLHEALEAGGYETHALVIELNEQRKTLDTASRIYNWLAEMRAERADCLVAMGGGVTSDIVGYAAATWLRGVPVVHVPTTLASMVDASIGGKTAVNLPVGKNLVGAFKQPNLVLDDIDLLATLPARELGSGWAEAIKHALILDADLLETFEASPDEVTDMSSEIAEQVIRRSVQIKADIVSDDEFETGDQRVLLNYGHTIGHAIEAVTEYGEYLHGEAVSIGMMVAAHIANLMGMIGEELVDRQRTLLQRYDLPVSATALSPDDLIAATKLDKKNRSGQIRWVLLEGPGHATTRRDVPESVVRQALAQVITTLAE